MKTEHTHAQNGVVYTVSVDRDTDDGYPEIIFDILKIDSKELTSNPSVHKIGISEVSD